MLFLLMFTITTVVFWAKKVSLSCSFMAIANLFCLMLGGMETLETSKPDLVFDGELDFEKGVMFTTYACIFILVHRHVYMYL